MPNPTRIFAATLASAMLFALPAGPASAATYVYVSNGEDGDIGSYRLNPDGSLTPLARVSAGPRVGPLSVSPDKRFLVAATRAKPYTALTYAIHPGTGALELIGSAALADSLPYISHDRSGRFLLGASYGGNLVSVNLIVSDGRVADPVQVIPTARNAHAIIVDRTNHHVFVPHLGTDQVFQFTFDAEQGQLLANTPPLVQLQEHSGPRHLVVSSDNRFVYVLNELTGTVTTLALDAHTGLLSEVATVSALPSDTTLRPGAARVATGAAGSVQRDRSHDIWASDIHLTPNGDYLYTAERTGSSISILKVDSATGRLTYVDSVPTEKQPRGFAIDPAGRTMVVSGELSDMIASYAIHPTQGTLTLIGRYATGKGSNWVEMVSFE